MKKIYVKSLFDLEKDRKVKDSRDWDLISDLIMYDLDNNYIYYVFNTNVILKESKMPLNYIASKNHYMTLALKDTYPISEEKFNELLNTPGRQFYQMYKKELLISLGLEELII